MPPILGELDTCAWPSPHLGHLHNNNNSPSSLALGHPYNNSTSSTPLSHHFSNDNTSSRLGHGSFKNGHTDPLVLLLSHEPERQSWDPVTHTSSSSSLCEEENSGGGSRSSAGEAELEGGAYPSKKKPRRKEMTDKRKSRGRPLGSKNKPKEPIIITRDDIDGMRPHVLEVAGGCDVIESLVAYSRREQRGVCILGGSGNVANITFRQPSAPGANVQLYGSYQILSLSGAILRQATPLPSNMSNIQNFNIALVGGSGQVVGGTVVGGMLAAGSVLLNVASFPEATIERLPLNEIEENVNLQNGSEDHASAHLQIAPPDYDMCNVNSHMGIRASAAELLKRVNYANLPWLQAS